FYSSPTVEIQGKKASGILCVDDGAPLRIQAQGDASNEYAWYLKGNPTTPIGSGTVLNRAFDKDTLLYVVASNGGSCTAADSARIVLNGKKRAVADTTVCIGSEFSFSMPKQQDVSYRWYAPDGTDICPCETLRFDEDSYHIFMAKDEGTYKVEIIRNGCTVTQNIDIKGYPEPVMDFGTTENPVAFCAGSPLVLSVQPKIDGKVESGYFVWTDPVGTELLEGDGKNTYVKDSALMVDRGVYTVAVTLKNGCTHSALVNVRVDDHTQPVFFLQSYYCEGDVADLNAVYQGDGSSYEWFSESGRRVGPSAEYKASLTDLVPSDSGRLYLVVTRGACKDTAYRNLVVRERPASEIELHGGIFKDGERFFCEGQTVLISLKNVLPGDSILWILPNGEHIANVEDWHSNSVAVSDQGDYNVTVMRNGCAAKTKTVNLDVRIVPVLILQDTFLCQGRDIVVNVENAAYPGAVYTWYELSRQAPEMLLDKGGEYHIIMDLRGCTDEGSFLLSERPVPEWDFPSDTSICNRDSLLLQGPAGADSYRWQDGSIERWFLVRSAGLYTLTVTDSGCANEKSVYVETEFCSPIFFPSAFTPNGDGINDMFGPISLAEEGELEYAFFIYNANGQMVFQSTDIRGSWDGTFKGQPCPAGIYTYRCKIIVAESGRDLSRIGTVHLIR
ncbi:MAG: gliding motility-associated C-terminal domain-containing protein, partial [Bacteroidales bacterium]|nr:gliding motility-associated C-terminal domain-containing protein [Bacteroidales bacterium]